VCGGVRVGVCRCVLPVCVGVCVCWCYDMSRSVMVSGIMVDVGVLSWALVYGKR